MSTYKSTYYHMLRSMAAFQSLKFEKVNETKTDIWFWDWISENIQKGWIFNPCYQSMTTNEGSKHN